MKSQHSELSDSVSPPPETSSCSSSVLTVPHLAVADLGVAVGVGGEHPPERGDAGGILEGGVVGQRAVEVALDLVCGQAALAH